jgi:hypothetical protein
MKYSATIGNAGYQNIIMPDLMHQCTIQHLIPPTKTIPNVIHIASNMQIYNEITAQRKKNQNTAQWPTQGKRVKLKATIPNATLTTQT